MYTKGVYLGLFAGSAALIANELLQRKDLNGGRLYTLKRCKLVMSLTELQKYEMQAILNELKKYVKDCSSLVDGEVKEDETKYDTNEQFFERYLATPMINNKNGTKIMLSRIERYIDEIPDKITENKMLNDSPLVLLMEKCNKMRDVLEYGVILLMADKFKKDKSHLQVLLKKFDEMIRVIPETCLAQKIPHEPLKTRKEL